MDNFDLKKYLKEGKLLEGSYDLEDIKGPEDIEEIDITNVEGKNRLYGVYIYLKGSESGTWDKKLGAGEFEKLINSFGISEEVDFSNSQQKLERIAQALRDLGIKAQLSEFDVS